LEPIRHRYDAILLDCPPSLGVLTVNALTAADGVIVPVQCEYLALEGLSSLLKSIQRVKAAFNQSLEMYGILLTMTDPRTSLCQEVTNDVRTFFGELVFKTAIPRNVRLAECPSFGKPVCLYDPHSSGAVSYYSVAQEILAKLFVPIAQPVEGTG
jgi:chromosome partitioning protein